MSAGHRFDPEILREYDIRGVFGATLTPDDAHAVGRAFAAILHSEHPERARRARVVVGRDGRLSSPVLEEALVAGLRRGGADVVCIGLAATPMLYFAEASLEQVDGGIQVTGSHNPKDHNGFKIVKGGAPFFGADLQRLGALAAAGGWQGLERDEEPGLREAREILDAYVARLLQGLAGLPEGALGRLRIGWDAGNGAAGPALEALVRRIPGHHRVLYAQVDGEFPHHHPDPTIEANLADLRALVIRERLDFGVAFDGDGDRIGVVDALGRIVWGDQLLTIFAQDVLQRSPGAAIVGDVKMSQTAFDRIAQLGGRAIMGEAGHSLVKARMKRTGALLGGEMSGHMFLADDYYGFDDGLYAAVRLIAATIRLGRSLTQLREAMPQTHATPELRFFVPEARKFAVVADVAAMLEEEGVAVCAVDGVRVRTADGWWLLRASNTQAALTARAESDTPEGLARLVAEIDRRLAAAGVQRT